MIFNSDRRRITTVAKWPAVSPQNGLRPEAAGLGRQMLVGRRLVSAGEHVVQFAVDALLQFRWKTVERRRVDEVAARVLEDSRLQVEVSQRATVLIARASLGKLLGEARCASDAVCQRSFAHKQKMFQNQIRRVIVPSLDAFPARPLRGVVR